MWLWEWINPREGPTLARLRSDGAVIRLAELAQASAMHGQLQALRGRVVLVATAEQLTTALALIELDGVARRLVLCPPDVNTAHLATLISDSEADACVRSSTQSDLSGFGIALNVIVQPSLQPADVARRGAYETEWILATSGTSGPPKLVVHTLASLTQAFAHQQPTTEAIVWSTFYDIRRYGGLQILLRALSGCTMLLPSPRQSVGEFLAWAGAQGVTHISGTASHWRAALMSGAAASIAPRYVRLSGEIADQVILDALRAAYPGARVAHAFASTEAGVAFEVGDGLAGFPASLMSTSGAVELRVAGERLQVRSAGTAMRYLGSLAKTLKDADGFVDTGDRVELHQGRYYFKGRSGGIINVGGLKVHPEEVEAVINAHPWVRMSLVKARRSPITGAVVTAEVVLADAAGKVRPPESELTEQILESCRRVLAAHKVPAFIRVVPALPLSGAGKLVRQDA